MMTNERKFQLMDKVGLLNNHPANVETDHLSFTMLFDTEKEFERHIAKLEENIKEYENE